ncbi:MAG: hypothetical protein NTV52_10520 [Acidobacteria bacterium]|nr:hypothetical protein [Acidobacteriota bacterium]
MSTKFFVLPLLTVVCLLAQSESAHRQGNVSLGAVSKSRRESDLEGDIRYETDARRRDQMSRELRRLASDSIEEKRDTAGRLSDEAYRILGDRANLGSFEKITATWARSGSVTPVIFITEVAINITGESR